MPTPKCRLEFPGPPGLPRKGCHSVRCLLVHANRRTGAKSEGNGKYIGMHFPPVHIVAPSKVVLLLHLLVHHANFMFLHSKSAVRPKLSVFTVQTANSLQQAYYLLKYLHLATVKVGEPTRSNPESTRLESWLLQVLKTGKTASESVLYLSRKFNSFTG